MDPYVKLVKMAKIDDMARSVIVDRKKGVDRMSDVDDVENADPNPRQGSKRGRGCNERVESDTKRVRAGAKGCVAKDVKIVNVGKNECNGVKDVKDEDVKIVDVGKKECNGVKDEDVKIVDVGKECNGFKDEDDEKESNGSDDGKKNDFMVDKEGEAKINGVKMTGEEKRDSIDGADNDVEIVKDELEASSSKDCVIKDDNGNGSKEKKRRAKDGAKNYAGPIEDDQDDDDFVKKPSTRISTWQPKCFRPKKRKPNAKASTVPRCSVCFVRLDSPSLLFYPGHPENAEEEAIALTQVTVIENGMDVYSMDGMGMPQYRLTDFTVYDTEGHIAPFDAELIEKGVELFVSGRILSLTADVDKEKGTPVRDAGPINWWWITGFEADENHLVGISTGMADYFLDAPSDSFKPVMDEVNAKVLLAKKVICLLNAKGDTFEYEDMMAEIEGEKLADVEVTEDLVVKHAEFILDQVFSYEQAGDEEDAFMLETPAMQNLMQLSGLRARKNKQSHIRASAKPKAASRQPQFSLATVTPCVESVFESFFNAQIAKSEKGASNSAPRRHRCNVCENCLAPDCGQCNSCKNMKKFGGSGKAKQACELRRCANAVTRDEAEAQNNTEDDEEEPVIVTTSKKKVKHLAPLFPHMLNGKSIQKDVKMKGESFFERGPRTYYHELSIGDSTYKQGDFVVVRTNEGEGLRRISYIFEKRGVALCHLQWFVRGVETVLGDTAEGDTEIFQVAKCDDVKAHRIVGKIGVRYRPATRRLSIGDENKVGENGHHDNDHEEDLDDGQLWFRLRYDDTMARFEHALEPGNPSGTDDSEDPTYWCGVCPVREQLELNDVTEVKNCTEEEADEDDRFHWRTLLHKGEEYEIDDAVLVEPPATMVRARDDRIDMKSVDEELYPEYYRKSKANSIKGSNESASKPFAVAIIVAITSRDEEGTKERQVKLRRLYRPEDTMMSKAHAYMKDHHLLYWSNDIVTRTVDCIRGRCIVRPNLDGDKKNVDDEFEGRPSFYYIQSYDKADKAFGELSAEAERYNGPRKAKGGKGAGGKKGKKLSDDSEVDGSQSSSNPKPLRALDVFAGCGGLSLGLHQAGVAVSKWAIECFEPAAKAFKLNNPDCEVFVEDCNLLLKMIIDGKATNARGQRLPSRGEVDLLCGGPPCQGFSGMNRFNHREYSAFKNSLIASYLSFCDTLRPKYFILENVRNFASFKSSAVLRLCLKALINMGYACTFGVLQAGNFGVPQTRRRLILLASAPGCALPLYPEPRTVFAKTQLNVQINEKLYRTNIRYNDSAPFRTVTVRDVMSDLPAIHSGQQDLLMSYGCEAQTHFQREMRAKVTENELRDHICKAMSPLVEARMEHIPTTKGSDWRDLPNIAIRLRDGSFCDKLLYNYHDPREGKGANNARRGVCACALDKPCEPRDRQSNTLIPWCLPHTSHRHNQWAGLYGRLQEDGHFSTTVTNPEPMGKQGRVLHPTQHRVVSVRECARSQGFPDHYKFFGSVLEKHRQVGNAVPPPMGKAIGSEIKRALLKNLGKA